MRDLNQNPVNGIPVTFQADPSCEGIATLNSTREVTREPGVAHATVQADNSIGVCYIAVQVDNVAEKTHVTVSPAPTMPSLKRRFFFHKR